jgi:hypothetical protein
VSLLELCEEGSAFLPAHQRDRPYVRSEEWILNGNVVARLRLRPDRVAAAVAELRLLGREHSLEKIIWMCGTLSKPPDLPERLEQQGLDPWDDGPVLTSLALTRPPLGQPTADVRRVRSFADFQTAQAINHAVYGVQGERLERARSRQSKLWEDAQQQDAVYYLGYSDGQPVAWARAFFRERALILQGAATLADARGAGVYTSLVHARWKDAVARGTPTLLVQATEMSRPILERLGFDRLGEIRNMVDEL